MIQLATDPNASRTAFSPLQGEDAESKSEGFEQRRRSGHAWPFLARYDHRPSRPQNQKPAARSSGS